MRASVVSCRVAQWLSAGSTNDNVVRPQPALLTLHSSKPQPASLHPLLKRFRRRLSERRPILQGWKQGFRRGASHPYPPGRQIRNSH
jgi:uncharacterized Zn-finger protein